MDNLLRKIIKRTDDYHIWMMIGASVLATIVEVAGMVLSVNLAGFIFSVFLAFSILGIGYCLTQQAITIAYQDKMKEIKARNRAWDECRRGSL